MTSCMCCGRTLTNAESIRRGIGPVCLKKGVQQALREELRALSRATPLDKDAEIELINCLLQNNINITSTTFFNCDKTAKRYERKKYRYLHEFSIHAPERLAKMLPQFSNYDLVAILYDVVTNEYSRLMVALYGKYVEHKRSSEIASAMTQEVFC